MLREIRGLAQRDPERTKRWFQDDFFDLYVWQDAAGMVHKFQLCYRRETLEERVFEWQRGLGFLHLKPEPHRPGVSYLENDTWALVFDGALPYRTVSARFAEASARIPHELADLILAKLNEFAGPGRKFRPRGARTPRWLARLRLAGKNSPKEEPS